MVVAFKKGICLGASEAIGCQCSGHVRHDWACLSAEMSNLYKLSIQMIFNWLNSLAAGSSARAGVSCMLTATITSSRRLGEIAFVRAAIDYLSLGPIYFHVA